MFRVRELLLLPIQLVFLIGTLPYSFELELVNILLSIIKVNYLRPNISYRASPYITKKEKD